MEANYDLLILGGGIAGMTAAIYAARANLSVCLIEREVCGGLVNWTHTVENVPSYTSVHGMDLMAKCREQVEALGVEIMEVNGAADLSFCSDVSKKALKKIALDDGTIVAAHALIIATGRKPIALPVQTDFEKVHYCSVCDGSAYKGKDVLVVGGGNSAFDESLYLAELGTRSIHIIEMLPEFPADAITRKKARTVQCLRANANTKLVALEKMENGRARASLEDTTSGKIIQEDIEGVFCFIGQRPNTELFEGMLEIDNGYIVTDELMRASFPGVFAAGDVRAKQYRQITTAMGDGTIAALEALKYLRG